MSTNTRAQEIFESMNTFKKDTYHRSEVLTELFALQEEIVRLTFNTDHAELANLKIWDVERHLEQINEELGGIATEQLQRFENGCKDLCNMIKMEISGTKGENKAFRSLERLRCSNRVIRNLELTSEDARTELDAVVVTSKGLFIVEVKNTSKDIFIDEEGKYFRTGEFLKFDCFISEKMTIKERLLREVLQNGGVGDLPIYSIVVFTDNRIQVRNCFKQLNTCFLSQLPYIIQEKSGEEVILDEQLGSIEQIIEVARCNESYPLKIDISQFKKDFAMLMATIEEASAEIQEVEEPKIVMKTETVHTHKQEKAVEPEWSFFRAVKTVLSSRYFRAAVPTAAAFAITLVTTAISTKHSF